MLATLIRLFSVLAVLFLLGCETEPMSFDDPSKFASKVQYFKDAKGNCFAIIGIRRTGTAYMSGIGLTYVPKENCR